MMDQISTAVGQCYDRSMPYGVSINGEKDFDTNGDIHNLQLAQTLEMLARDLVVYGKLIREQLFNHDLMSSESNTFAEHYRVYP